jgi:hypothetical protein
MHIVSFITTTLQTLEYESKSVSIDSETTSLAQAIGGRASYVERVYRQNRLRDQFASHISLLQKVVTAFDQDMAGPEAGSLAELGIRAQTLVILLLLDELWDVMKSGASIYQDLFTGRLETIDDVAAFLFESLGRINRLWLPYRARPHATGIAAIETTRPFLYRSAIRRAQRAIRALAEDPDFSHFLRTGSNRTDTPQVCSACDELSAALNIALTRDPDPALFFAAAAIEPEELFDLVEAHDERV